MDAAAEGSDATDDECSSRSDQDSIPQYSAAAEQFSIDVSVIPCVQKCSQLSSLGVKAYDQRSYENSVVEQAEKHFSANSSKYAFSFEPSTSQSLANDDSVEYSENISHEEDDISSHLSDNETGACEDEEWVLSQSASEEEYECFDEVSLKRKSRTHNLHLPKQRKVSDVKRSLSEKKKIVDDGLEKNYRERIRQVSLFMTRYKLETTTEQGDTVSNNLTVVNQDFKVPTAVWNKLYPYQQSGVEWLWELHQNSCGGIMGDEMGLGKTIQVIAFLAGLACSEVHCFREETTKLGPIILVCPATVMYQWVQEFHSWWPPFRVAILHHTGAFKGNRELLIRNLNKCNGIIVTSYSSIVLYQDILYKYNWHYVILDEGHKIRNPDAQATLACKRFRTPHRLILSASPIQNNLKELWSLFDFIYPGKLGTLPVFMEHFAVPITQGGYANASDVQVQIAYKCATVLQSTVKPFLLRRVKDDLKDCLNLPNKNEQVLFCKLTDIQREVYSEYLKSPEIKDIFSHRTQVFVGLVNLRKICNHPNLFITARNESECSSKDFYKKSGKLIVVDALLKIWKKQKHKVLLFTQGKQMLNILESFVKYREYTYLIMDGSTPVANRQQIVKEFNQDPNIFLFLLTTRVGGIGVNLTGASRVVIFDPDWNPSTDVQARERAWRIGQDKQVTIYRLLTAGTVEEKIYHRQIFKQYLTNRVLKNAKQQRFFKTNDLYELFTLGSDSKTTESSAIFAGTNSEVKVKKNAKNPKLKDTKNDVLETTVELPPEKIRELRERAKKLSEMISKKFSKNNSGASSSYSVSDMKSAHKHNSKSSPKKSTSSPKLGKGTVFEGKRIKYLVKSGTVEQRNPNDDQNISVKQDDYVLKKLFKKSGVHSALKHDVIEGVANPDYAIIEKEAENIATDAIKALKKSRAECLGVTSGIPTWTGLNARAGPSKHSNSLGSKSISSGSLIKAIKERNQLESSSDLDINSEYGEMLNDIRSFISFQSKVSGEATTEELLQFFNKKLPLHFTSVFKSLLWKFCDFHRSSAGTGIWTIKSEFR